MNNKAMIAIVALVVFIGGFLFLRGSNTKQALAPATEQTTQNNVVTKTASGKLDDIITALDSEDAQEAASVEAGNTDVDTALSDESIINDLSQSYDETSL